MSRSGIAKQTLEIIERGSYVAPSGRTVELRAAIDAAVRGTALYAPEALDRLAPAGTGRPRIEVTDETTGAAARRLVEDEGAKNLLALNFASAKNPGGGFLGGAKAQEEDLACASALYPCLRTQPRYYEVHRASPSMLYTDHMIHSPDVPFFRDEDHGLLERPFLVSILTSPAPNAGEAQRKQAGEEAQVERTLRRRAGKILALAAERGHRCLVLGAWGCGVFRNDPELVAEAFAPVVGLGFERVVFAVYDRGKEQPNLRAFQRRFG
jgi:uncharacterized protein (TIGR02452 family)